MRLLDSVNWIALDVETTGLDPEVDVVVEVAALRFRGSREVDRFATLVNSGISIPAVASSIHGITDTDVAAAPPWTQVLDRLQSFTSHDSIMVAHHAAFDRAFIRGVPDEAFVDAGPPVRYRWLCTRTLSRRLLPEAGDRSLSALRHHCRLEAPKTLRMHRALDDAIITAELFRHLVSLYENWEPDAVQTLRQLIAAAQEPLS